LSRTSSADLSGLAIDRNAPDPGRARGVKWIRGALLAVVALAIGVVVYGLVSEKTIDVRVARAEPLGGTPGVGGAELLTANGYVVARQRASVSSEVSGRLAALYVEEGSRVVEGQVLGMLQNQDQRAAVESAKAALAAAEAQAAEAKASAREADLELGRSRELLAKGLVSQADFDAVQAKADVAGARVQSAEAQIGSARANLDAAQVAWDRTFIRAPFAGAVLRKEAEVGEIVSPIPSSGGLTRGAIVTMANLATLQVDVDVNEGYVARTHEGMRTEIALDAYPDDRFPGRVRQIVPTADRQKATVLVKVSFDSLDARVLPDMGAKVTFFADAGAAGAGTGAAPPAAATAVSIPREAVQEREGRAVVYVVEDGRANERGIAPRPLGPDRVSVSGGIAPGEVVIVDAPPGLADKARVRVR
jgi:RND family efflux transporter MFP subunit